nr:hypothetical protein Iba_chr14cCG9600 [Ipomoea batatas]
MGLQVGEETCRRRDYAAAAETSIPADVVLVEMEMEMDDTHKEGYTVVLGLERICKLAEEESCSEIWENAHGSSLEPSQGPVHEFISEFPFNSPQLPVGAFLISRVQEDATINIDDQVDIQAELINPMIELQAQPENGNEIKDRVGNFVYRAGAPIHAVASS